MTAYLWTMLAYLAINVTLDLWQDAILRQAPDDATVAELDARLDRARLGPGVGSTLTAAEIALMLWTVYLAARS